MLLDPYNMRRGQKGVGNITKGVQKSGNVEEDGNIWHVHDGFYCCAEQ